MTAEEAINVVKTLDAETIAARLDELEEEQAALNVLLRSARAKEKVRGVPSRPATEQHGQRRLP
jgi:hypothetical protein